METFCQKADINANLIQSILDNVKEMEEIAETRIIWSHLLDTRHKLQSIQRLFQRMSDLNDSLVPEY